MTGFPTKYGIYIASIAEDTNLVNNGERSRENSCWEIYLTTDNADETRVGDGLYRKRIFVDMLGNSASEIAILTELLRLKAN